MQCTQYLPTLDGTGSGWFALVHLLFSRTVQEHFQNLTEVFQRLKQAGLKLKPRKCHLFGNKVKYLGYVVSNKGVEADTEKIQCVLDWPTPTSPKQIRQFLGIIDVSFIILHRSQLH